MFAWQPSSVLNRNDVQGLAAVLVVGILVVSCGLGIYLNSDNYLNSDKLVAAVATNQNRITVGWLSCLSVDAHKLVYAERDYWDDSLLGEIADKLAVKVVLANADYAACRWGFFATVVPGAIRALRYNGDAAQYLISIGVCERTVDGSMNASECVDKNVYVFNQRVTPHDLFSVALVGLAKSQTAEWEVFKHPRSN
jgi:hypothetical protein